MTERQRGQREREGESNRHTTQNTKTHAQVTRGRRCTNEKGKRKEKEGSRRGGEVSGLTIQRRHAYGTTACTTDTERERGWRGAAGKQKRRSGRRRGRGEGGLSTTRRKTKQIYARVREEGEVHFQRKTLSADTQAHTYTRINGERRRGWRCKTSSTQLESFVPLFVPFLFFFSSPLFVRCLSWCVATCVCSPLSVTELR